MLRVDAPRWQREGSARPKQVRTPSGCALAGRGRREKYERESSVKPKGQHALQMRESSVEPKGQHALRMCELVSRCTCGNVIAAFGAYEAVVPRTISHRAAGPCQWQPALRRAWPSWLSPATAVTEHGCISEGQLQAFFWCRQLSH